MPESGVLSSLGGPLLSCALGFAGGYVLNRVTQREIRHYERETKRLQLLKAFYDLRTAEKASVSPEFDERALAIESEAQRWIESIPNEGALLARALSAALASIVTIMFLSTPVRWASGLLSRDLRSSTVLPIETRILLQAFSFLLIALLFGGCICQLFVFGARWAARKIQEKWPGTWMSKIQV